MSEYTKQQFLASRRFGAQRDLIRALLEDGKSYTIKQVLEIIEEFQKRKVL